MKQKPSNPSSLAYLINSNGAFLEKLLKDQITGTFHHPSRGKTEDASFIQTKKKTPSRRRNGNNLNETRWMRVLRWVLLSDSYPPTAGVELGFICWENYTATYHRTRSYAAFPQPRKKKYSILIASNSRGLLFR